VSLNIAPNADELAAQATIANIPVHLQNFKEQLMSILHQKKNESASLQSLSTQITDL
jgi:hypothetical protein